ncbi:MAG TPA: arylsulfate sulfotransferase [Phycisphaerales bacterium]|jgi:predicted DNA-binding ribbon-helix-helix protein|nr:arylsulfate sulfotransferase [Parvibaculum sp.]HIB65510.1 arylsulfate sulfotransferase [Phycisphaerales bacterium]|tara:strand:+ start:1011 stop:1247 length:237 start_codon:yes stop_codon:yes gene_type:complete
MSAQIKRSITISGHRTSITLERPFWDELKEIACRKKVSVTELVRQIDSRRDASGSLTSAIRVFILEQLKKQRSDLRQG